MGGIVGQADQYAVFDTPPRPERVAREAPAEVIREYTRGRSVGAGQLNPRGIRRQHFAVNTMGMDPDEHAYHEESYGGPYDAGGQWLGDETGGPRPLRDWDPNTGYQPDEMDEHEAEGVHADDESGYNWGPVPGHQIGADPGPHPDFSGGDQVHPHGTPIYNPRSSPYDHFTGSRLGFNRLRRLADDGAAPVPVAAPMFTHMFVPGHRVGLPYNGAVIPGIITHLDGTSQVGVRWNDGQHSVEDARDVQPL